MTYVWSAVGTVEVNGVRLGCREAGDPDGTPVVLLHGSGSSAGTWDRFAARLRGRRTIAIDLRGHATSARTRGYALASIRDDVLGLIEALRLRDTVLIGHSVGGYAALAAALEAPELIGRLVLEDLAAPPKAPGSTTRINPVQALGAVAGILGSGCDYQLRAVASLLRQLSRPDPAWWARLGEVSQPTLILSGGPASCIPPHRLAEVTAAIPNARLATIPVGHRVHSLAPAEFADEVLTFLAQTEPAIAPAPVMAKPAVAAFRADESAPAAEAA
ncbi:alpha/beta hydrolase [Actinoplanes sp. KI2]|uniref:alpha/beta fold hydrolase n=1 Tax=Actinoplanes sp. KI2 TaxID=2983315 RepID=UPI0021D5BE9E|nr:alpha/beta hydrolase [Actinoplanes sp. KI2]MCU7727906.1 alpha/beta hydrolase [Actinoplanes sp. KI2]